MALSARRAKTSGILTPYYRPVIVMIRAPASDARGGGGQFMQRGFVSWA